MANKKYEITSSTKTVNGKTLSCIRALKDFGDIRKGDWGGYIQSENNLSHDGDCWVYAGAHVFEDARVTDEAKVYGHAKVFGKAQVYDRANVRGKAKVFDYAQVYGNSDVRDEAKIFISGRVYENAKVYGKAQVFGSGRVYGNAKVYGDTWIADVAEVRGNVMIHTGKYSEGILGSEIKRPQKTVTQELEKDLMSKLDGEDVWNESDYRLKK
jgi:carbonic anhydrase/acetyltransferase-like protein (isoleucine patch superfamily)